MSDIVPEGWRRATILELGNSDEDTVQTGPFGAQLHASDYVDEGVPLILIRNIKDFGLDERNIPKISEGDAERLYRYRLKPGDIVFSRVGRVGSCFLATEREKGWVISGQTLRMRVDPKQVDPGFLVCELRTDENQREIVGESVGSTRTSINTTILGNLQVRVPPLPEQQKIAAILSSVDDVIEKTRAQIDKLEDLKTGMMQELLTKGIGHREFKDSPVGRIPENWEITNLGSIVIPKGLQTGPFGSQLHAHEYVERGVPVVMPKDMKMNRIDPTSIAYIPEARAEQLDKHRVRKGDLLFARRGDIGRFALVESKNEGWVCGTGCLKARLSPRINPIFISSYLTLTPVIEWLNLNAVGQTMLNLNTAILADLPIILPPDDEQEIIGDAISALDNRISSCHRKLISLTRVKSALMQDLLTGKVRVKVGEKETAVA